VGVAIIDSGIDSAHVALRNRVIATVDFTGGNGVDGYGHGTHVAAVIAGQRSEVLDGSTFQGIASGAHLINLRVLNERGAGRASSVIEAIDWAIDNRDLYQIRIINLSIGAPVLQPYRDDPLCEAVERAVAAGIIVVTSAGNHGVSREGTLQYGSVTSPGNDPNVITVGALDAHNTADRRDDTVASYSSRGPTAYDLVMKPDLVAPGSQVVSAEVAGSLLLRIRPERHVTGFAENAYMELSGTSMSAGVVSGAVALLLEKRPRLSAGEVKAVLVSTSSRMPEGPLASGAGSLDVFAACQLLEILARDPSLWRGGKVGIRRLSAAAEPGINEAEFEWDFQSPESTWTQVADAHTAWSGSPDGTDPGQLSDRAEAAGKVFDVEFVGSWAVHDD
jgi:serine protease AprX